MTTSDYALIVSITAIVVSIAALAWNVWQKFLFVKPSLQVSFGLFNVLQPSNDGFAHPTGQKLLDLTVTNMGPGSVVLFACIARSKYRGWGKSRLGMLNPIHGDPTSSLGVTSIGPFSAGLPLKLEAGDVKTFYFPFSADCFLADGMVQVGVNDTYHRNTWCHRSDVRKVNAEFKNAFSAS